MHSDSDSHVSLIAVEPRPTTSGVLMFNKRQRLESCLTAMNMLHGPDQISSQMVSMFIRGSHHNYYLS